MMAPKVFISYSHDSETHKARVAELSKRLRTDGIDCMIDQYVAAPPEGWTLWMQRQLEESRFVLIVCTEIYADRVARRVSTGNGVKYEGALIIRELYEAGMNNERFVPVLLDGADSDHILISIPPKYAVSQVVGCLKGKSAIHVARSYRGSRSVSGENPWARGYFASTVGRDEAIVRRYIREQENEDRRLDHLERQ